MNQIKNRYTGKVICEGENSIRTLADENRAYLEGAYLGAAHLEGADLRGAHLGGAYLGGAYLRGAYLGAAYLEGAYLEGAYLRGADLRGAYLEGAYLEGAYLGAAHLGGAYLGGAYLEGAYLGAAHLEGADLRGAYLGGAYLEAAHLEGAKIEFWQFPSIRLLSSINLDILSDDLTTELFQRDTAAHPKPELFKAWAKDNGPCPYKNEERWWWFELRKECWKPGKPKMTDCELIFAICKEKGWKIKGYL